MIMAVCDETQNLNETESETFFRYQFFSIPIPILFSIPIFFRYQYRYFFRYQNFSDTNTDTFFDTKFFRNQYRNFFSIPKIFETDTDTFSIPIFFETDTDTIKKHGKVSKPKCCNVKICGLDNVIVIMPTLKAFQPCSTLWVQKR